MEENRIKVFYDYDAFYRDHKFGGIARCFIETMKHLKCDYFLSVKYSLVYYINEVLPGVSDFCSIQFRGKARIRKILNLVYTYWNLIFQKYDIVHLTGEELYASWLIRKPIVCTMHDCVLEKIFNGGVRSENRLKLMQKASAIVAVSKNTKKDLLEFYPEIPADKIHVIYHGYSGFAESKGVNQWGRYILNVGMRQTYKNYANLLKAMVVVMKYDKDIKLVSAGKPFDASETLLIEQLGLSDRVISVQCNDETLADLYKYAQAFVYPSIYEGFGIPILEAWSFETPVVLSDTSCFPEVAGEAGRYFDPSSPESIADALMDVLNNDDLKSLLVAKGNERLRMFSWDKTSETHLNLYNLLAKQRK